jgi:hypothetical protein
MKSDHTLLSYSISFRSKLILAHHLDRGLQSSPFPLGFHNKTLCAFLSPMHAAWLEHITLTGFNTQRIFREEYKLWSSSMCNFLQNCYFLPFMFKHYTQHCISIHSQSSFFPSCERPSFTPIQNNRLNKVFIYFNFMFVLSQWENWRFRTEY